MRNEACDYAVLRAGQVSQAGSIRSEDAAVVRVPHGLAATLPVVISHTDAIYLYGLDIIAEQLAGAERYYYVHDGLGSVRQVLDSTGQIATRYAYDPFGVPLAGNGVSNPWQFTGEAWDAKVELLYLRARYYQPGTGRFITNDPWPGSEWRPGTLNRYVYVTNNPFNLVDPTGFNNDEPPDTPTPTPTLTPEQLQREMQRVWQEKFGEPYPGLDCTVPLRWTMPDRVIGAYSPEYVYVRGAVVRQFFVSSPERSVKLLLMFWARAEPGQTAGAVPGGRKDRSVVALPILAVVRSSLMARVTEYQYGTLVDLWHTYDTSGLLALQSVAAFRPKLSRSVAVMIPGVRWDHWPETGFETIPPGQRGEDQAVGVWVVSEKGRPTGLLMSLGLEDVGGLVFTFGWPWLGVSSYSVPFYGHG